jgi:hypothetical protein
MTSVLRLCVGIAFLAAAAASLEISVCAGMRELPD